MPTALGRFLQMLKFAVVDGRRLQIVKNLLCIAHLLSVTSMIHKACPRRHLAPQSLCRKSIGSCTSDFASHQCTLAQEIEASGQGLARPIELILSKLSDVSFPARFVTFYFTQFLEICSNCLYFSPWLYLGVMESPMSGCLKNRGMKKLYRLAFDHTIPKSLRHSLCDDKIAVFAVISILPN
jgi:hypothetical protein